MKRLIIYWSIFLSLVVSSCSNDDYHGDTYAMPHKFERLGDLVESIEILPLESDGVHLLGSRVDLAADGCDWYLSDKENGKIFRYSADGTFLNEIGRRGNGPGEFIKLQDVQIVGDTVVCFSFPNRVYYYSKNGKLIDTRTFENLGDNSVLTDGGVLTYRGYRPDKHHRMSFIQKSGTSNYLQTKRRVMNLSTGDPVFCEGPIGVSVIDSYSRTVHCFSGGQLSPYVHFDLGKYNIPDEFFRFADPYAGAEYLLQRDFGRVSRFIMGSDSWIAELALQKGSSTAVDMVYCYKAGEIVHWFKQSSSEAFFSAFRLFEADFVAAIMEVDAIHGMPQELYSRISNASCIQSLKGSDYVIAKVHFK